MPRQRHNVLGLHFHSRRGNDPCRTFKIDLVPRRADQLAGSYNGEREKAQRELWKRGEEAIPALEKVAKGDDPEAAAATGVDVFWCRMAAVAVSCAASGIAGVWYAFYYNNLFPEIAFDIGKSVELTFAPIVGGVGSLFADGRNLAPFSGSEGAKHERRALHPARRATDADAHPLKVVGAQGGPH